jgi:hypothetical protein
MHPLDYKTINYYKENKILTIEELIECSKLTCDGQYPGMEEYSGLPFYAVVPLEITNYSYLLNSHNFFKDVNCRMDINKFSNNKKSKNTTVKNIEVKKTTVNTNRSGNTKKTNASSNSMRNNSVLNRTVILKVNERDNKLSELRNEKEKKTYLNNLFINPNMKVYSNLIAPNGLLFTILYDSSTRKFYYLVLEVDIINIISKEKEGSNLKILKTYKKTHLVFVKTVYGIPADQSIIKIRLVK